MQEEKDYESEQGVEVEEMGSGGSDTGESIAEEDKGDIPPSADAVTQ